MVFSLFFAFGKKFTLFRALSNDRGCFVLCGARLAGVYQYKDLRVLPTPANAGFEKSSILHLTGVVSQDPASF